MTEFFSTAGSQDHAWILFILIVLFSSTFGKNWLFSKLEIPIITGYMIMGFIFGPYAFGVMSIKQTHELGYVNQAALAFIATSAGAEIYLPEIMPLIKPIAWISTLAITFTLVIGTAFAYGVGGTPLLPWLVGYNSCNLGIAMLIATIMTSLSPTSVLAVVRASGPITHIMIGITVAADVVVLTIFAIVQTMTQNLCSGKEFDVATFFVNLLLILVWGWLLGHLIVRLLYFKRLKHLILPICFLNYLICEYILAVSAASGDFEINIDALLICISAGYVAGNSVHREKLVDYLTSLSLYVFIPFFTAVGLQLNLPVLLNALGFSVLASVVRAACMAGGTVIGGGKAGLAEDKARRLWLGLLPQAGVSLGLAGIIGHQFRDTFGSDFQATCIGIILTNQCIGPIGAKYLLRYSNEDGKGGVEGESDHFKQVALACNDGVQMQLITGVTAETQTETAFFAPQEGGWDAAFGAGPSSGASSVVQAAYHDDAEQGRPAHAQPSSTHTSSDPGGYELVAGASDSPLPEHATTTHARAASTDTGTGGPVEGQYKTLAPRLQRRASGYSSFSVLDHAGKGLNRTAAQGEGDTAENPLWAAQTQQSTQAAPAMDSWVEFIKESL